MWLSPYVLLCREYGPLRTMDQDLCLYFCRYAGSIERKAFFIGYPHSSMGNSYCYAGKKSRLPCARLRSHVSIAGRTRQDSIPLACSTSCLAFCAHVSAQVGAIVFRCGRMRGQHELVMSSAIRDPVQRIAPVIRFGVQRAKAPLPNRIYRVCPG